jgi:hypothetical protein
LWVSFKLKPQPLHSVARAGDSGIINLLLPGAATQIVDMANCPRVFLRLLTERSMLRLTYRILRCWLNAAHGNCVLPDHD